MNVLITGANGFVGRALCAEAVRRKHTVRAIVRTGDSDKACTIGQIDGNTDWGGKFNGVDVIIHLAARVHVMNDCCLDPLSEFRKVNVEGTVKLAQSAASAGVRRFVYVSSIKVNGEVTPKSFKFSESDAVNPQDPYSISKWEAEQALHFISTNSKLEVVIVRPPLVYGAGVKGNFAQMIKILAHGIPLPLASVNNLRSLIYLGNLQDALLLCATHVAAAGQTYLISDGLDISTTELLRLLGDATNHPARLFPCPTALLKLAGKLSGKSAQVDRLTTSLRIDSSKICRELGWIPPFSLHDGLRLMAQGD